MFVVAGSCRQPQTYVKPEATITVFELLMMSVVSLETCWAIKKQWNNKFYYTVASCWLFLYNLYNEARTHEYQVLLVNHTRDLEYLAAPGKFIVLAWSNETPGLWTHSWTIYDQSTVSGMWRRVFWHMFIFNYALQPFKGLLCDLG